MNILHYSLGLPPYRTGGLTKYSFDLMKEQASLKDNIFLLFPGKISLVNKNTRIKYLKKQNQIEVYEFINPLPVPLLNGVCEPEYFMKSCDKKIFREFLIDNKINIIHIHTFMGLYKELLEICHELGIKIVYTTHDYFGLCTKVNFVDYNGDLCKERNLEKCLKCNKSAYSMKTITILQSPIYRFLKNNGITPKVKTLVQKLKGNKKIISNYANAEIEVSREYRKSFNNLLNYYNDMFNYIDVFLFNSNIAKSVYEKYTKCTGKVISITHGDIKDNRKIKNFNHDKLKITYLGPNKKYKGFDLLIDTMKELNKEYKSNIELNLYGDRNELSIDTNIKFNGRYSYEQLSSIFDNTDLLVVPSIWNETFGFIVLEGLSYGVPVLVTDKVGSKDLIDNNELKKGIVVNGDFIELRDSIIKSIEDRKILINLNNNIINDKFKFDISNHSKDIELIYEEAVE